MAQSQTFGVRGYTELMRGLKDAERGTRLGIRSTFRKVGEAVRVGAAARIAADSPKTAAGYKVRVRQRGIAVEQTLRKTTGKHPEWGSVQMRRALLPSLAANQRRTEQAFEQALDDVARRFNEGA